MCIYSMTLFQVLEVSSKKAWHSDISSSLYVVKMPFKMPLYLVVQAGIASTNTQAHILYELVFRPSYILVCWKWLTGELIACFCIKRSISKADDMYNLLEDLHLKIIWHTIHKVCFYVKLRCNHHACMARKVTNFVSFVGISSLSLIIEMLGFASLQRYIPIYNYFVCLQSKKDVSMSVFEWEPTAWWYFGSHSEAEYE